MAISIILLKLIYIIADNELRGNQIDGVVVLIKNSFVYNFKNIEIYNNIII